jgi:hypothetical protein
VLQVMSHSKVSAEYNPTIVRGLYILDLKKVKVKESRNRPGVAQRVPGRLSSQIFMTFGT